MVTFATDAAATEALKVVIAEIHFCLVAVETCPWVHAGVTRTAKCRSDAVVVCFAKDLVCSNLIKFLEI